MSPTNVSTSRTTGGLSGPMADDSASSLTVAADVTSSGLLRPAGLPLADSTEAFQPPRTFQGISQGTFILLLVAVVAAGAIYVMRLTQGTLSANAEILLFEAKIEQALARFGASAANPAVTDRLLPGDTESIIAMFTDDVTRRQIPKGQLKSDPFMPKIALASEVKPSDTADKSPGVAPVPPRSPAAELNKLKLEAVVQGRMPIAIINGSLYQVGQRLGAFRIRSIQGMEVELESAGETHVLKIDRTLTRERSH